MHDIKECLDLFKKWLLNFSGLPAKKFLSLNNQWCQVIDVNTNEPLFYSCYIIVNNCGGKCNAIDNL